MSSNGTRPLVDLDELRAETEKDARHQLVRHGDLVALVELAEAALDPALFDRGALGSRASLRFARAAQAFREPQDFAEAEEPEGSESWSIIVEVVTDNPDPVRERLIRWLTHEFGLRARTKTIRTDHMQAMLRPLPSFQDVRVPSDAAVKHVRFNPGGHRRRHREEGGNA